MGENEGVKVFEAGFELRDSLNRLNVRLAGISVRLSANDLREAEIDYDKVRQTYDSIYRDGRKNPDIFSELEVYRRQIEDLRKTIKAFQFAQFRHQR